MNTIQVFSEGPFFPNYSWLLQKECGTDGMQLFLRLAINYHNCCSNRMSDT